jgi:hypothetical protein
MVMLPNFLTVGNALLIDRMLSVCKQRSVDADEFVCLSTPASAKTSYFKPIYVRAGPSEGHRCRPCFTQTRLQAAGLSICLALLTKTKVSFYGRHSEAVTKRLNNMLHSSLHMQRFFLRRAPTFEPR